MVSSLYSPEQENKEIWVYLEQYEGSLQHVSLELLCKGRQMADEMQEIAQFDGGRTVVVDQQDGERRLQRDSLFWTCVPRICARVACD